MKHGDAVEVHKVWSGGALIPLKSWFKGYEFVRECNDVQGPCLIVKHTDGVFKGVEVRYSAHEVRPATA